MRTCVAAALMLASVFSPPALAQSGTPRTAAPRPQPPPEAAKPPAPAAGVVPGADFVIGPQDVLGILFWKDQEMSGDVTVRPDGMITLPLIRDVQAAGLRPAELADRIQQAARQYISQPSVTVVLRQMNSRKVFITGEVNQPGAYPLATSMTVMQLIAIAGGLTEFAEPKNISIMRVQGSEKTTFDFNYKDVARGKNREQNIALKPGDTVVVP